VKEEIMRKASSVLRGFQGGEMTEEFTKMVEEFAKSRKLKVGLS